MNAEEIMFRGAQIGTLRNIDLMLSGWFCDNNGSGCSGCPFRDHSQTKDCPRHQVKAVLDKIDSETIEELVHNV